MGRKKPMQHWQKENMLELLDKNPKAVMKGLLILYRRQTIEERETRETNVSNSAGFDKVDARRASRLAVRLIDNRGFSEGELEMATAITKKYWRQLANVANIRLAMEVEDDIRKSVLDNGGEAGHSGKVVDSEQYSIL